MAYKYEKLECKSMPELAKRLFAGEEIYTKDIVGYKDLAVGIDLNMSIYIYDANNIGGTYISDVLENLYTRHEVEWWDDLPEGEFLVANKETAEIYIADPDGSGVTIGGLFHEISDLDKYFRPATKEEALSLVLPQDDENE